jgi:hypothetical protein
MKKGHEKSVPGLRRFQYKKILLESYPLLKEDLADWNYYPWQLPKAWG